MLNGLIIAAPASNSGKTFVTLGLLRALKNKGVDVASAKVGPDYIDPTFHSRASSRLCPNLDSWAMRDQTMAQLMQSHLAPSDLIVCEGVMGLFDGASLAKGDQGRDGSPADLARKTGWPVVLVVDATAQAASAAAVIKGFKDFDPDVHVKGVIFNKVGGPGHEALLKRAMETHLSEIKVLGYVPRQNDLRLPERHLGLVLAEEHPDLEAFFENAATFLSEHIDLDALAQLAEPAEMVEAQGDAHLLAPIGRHIAVAYDQAFAFVYQGLLESWKQQGSQLTFFSPLANEAPEKACDSVYLPGGYPELHGATLARNSIFFDGLREAAAQHKTIFGECGGYMVLGKAIIDADGQRHDMAGLLDLETSFEKRKLHLGYREVESLVDSPLGRAGTVFKGHEFHYATILHEEGEPLFQAKNAAKRDLGKAGLVKGSVYASFMHLIDQVS